MTGFPQRLNNLENENGHGKVMEHEKLPKVMEFCDHSWNFTNLVPELFVTTKNLSSSPIVFFAKRRKCKLGRKMVMENQEMAMQKSWKN